MRERGAQAQETLSLIPRLTPHSFTFTLNVVRCVRMKGKFPDIDKLCRVEWLDATGYIGVAASEAKPFRCETVGWLQKVNSDHIVIATSRYEDGSGDFTVIPKGMLISVRVV